MSVPWGEPGATPLADIIEWKRRAWEAWPPPPFTPVLTPEEEVVLGG